MKRVFLVLAAAVLLAGCSLKVNLAQRRRSYDAYLDLAGRAEAVAQQDHALLGDLRVHADDANQDPYPLLQAWVDAESRQASHLAGLSTALTDWERDYDAFAAGRAAVGPKDGPDWDAYRALDARFQPLGQGLRQDQQALEGLHQQFAARLRGEGIARLDAAALREECANYLDLLDQTLNRMDGLLYASRRREGDFGDGGDEDLRHRRREGLNSLEQSLLRADSFGRESGDEVQALREGLPTSGIVYFGPGQAGGGGLAGLWSAEDRWRGLRQDFEQRHRDFELACGAQRPPSSADTWQGPIPGGYFRNAGPGQGAAAQPVSLPESGGSGLVPGPSPVGQPVAAPAPTATPGPAPAWGRPPANAPGTGPALSPTAVLPQPGPHPGVTPGSSKGDRGKPPKGRTPWRDREPTKPKPKPSEKHLKRAAGDKPDAHHRDAGEEGAAPAERTPSPRHPGDE